MSDTQVLRDSEGNLARVMCPGPRAAKPKGADDETVRPKGDFANCRIVSPEGDPEMAYARLEAAELRAKYGDDGPSTRPESDEFGPLKGP